MWSRIIAPTHRGRFGELEVFIAGEKKRTNRPNTAKHHQTLGQLHLVQSINQLGYCDTREQFIWSGIACLLSTRSIRMASTEAPSHPPNLPGQPELRRAAMIESYTASGNHNGSDDHHIMKDGSMTMGDRDLAGLLQAVTSAVGQENGQHSSHGDSSKRRGMRGGHIEEDPVARMENVRDSEGYAELHGEGPFPAQADELQQASSPKLTRKRKRASNFDSDPTTYEGQQTNGTGVSRQEQNSQLALSEARAAGVHSAAALFRRPSASSKKYTRPPMSKLFTSLELSPENFLHLQAAAKTYMLDPNHPERRACVGKRGKGDTDMVKLRLYNCVRDFLELEGHGEKFFGEHIASEESEGRRLVWPSEKNL